MITRQRGQAPCLIGITGLPGSGKSACASAFAASGARVVSGDIAGHEALTKTSVYQELLRVFGKEIGSADGIIDRAALGRQLTGREKVAMLNRIVHPPLLEILAERVRAALDEPQCPMVAVDAALIPEWGIEPYFDLVIYVASPPELRGPRLEASGRDLVMIGVLEQSQLAEDAKRKRSHIVVDNLWSLEELNRRVHALFSALTRIRHEEASCPRRLWND
ncbi:dephospho-CoA kinase [Candidatus Fermentibacteria bacterium]|nr:dephospho-CoA kinase [Candidatus Fermentibacteria bacterium]